MIRRPLERRPGDDGGHRDDVVAAGHQGGADAGNGEERTDRDDRVRRAHHDALGRGECVHHGRGRPRPFGAGEPDGAHGDVVVQADEVVLERHLGAGIPELGLLGQCQHGAHGVVGDREQADVDLAAGREGGGDLGQ